MCYAILVRKMRYGIFKKKKSKNTSVKCPSDGELPSERKAKGLAVSILHPASYGTKRTIFLCLPYAARKGRFFMKKKNYSLFQSAKALALAAMLTAISVVIGILCKSFMNFGMGLFRVTFENAPIILSGILFGPIVGGMVGAATDLISYLLSPQTYPPNLIVTLGAFLIGFISGALSRLLKKTTLTKRIVLSGALAHAVGSMLVKSVGLYQFYGILVLWRIPLYLLIAPVEILLLIWLCKKSILRKMLGEIGGIK